MNKSCTENYYKVCTVIARSGTSKKRGGEKTPTDVKSDNKPKIVLDCCDIRGADTLRVRSGCDP